jgi:hypothetical protein
MGAHGAQGLGGADVLQEGAALLERVAAAHAGAAAGVRFCRGRVFPYRRLRIQGDQGLGRLGHKFTLHASLIVNSKILLKGIGKTAYHRRQRFLWTAGVALETWRRVCTLRRVCAAQHRVWLAYLRDALFLAWREECQVSWPTIREVVQRLNHVTRSACVREWRGVRRDAQVGAEREREIERERERERCCAVCEAPASAS